MGVRLGLELGKNSFKFIQKYLILTNSGLAQPKLFGSKIFLVCEIFLFIYEPFWSKIKILFSLSYEDKFWEKMMETQMPALGLTKASNPNLFYLW